MIGLYTGMRINEIAMIELDDVGVKKKSIRIPEGKTETSNI